MASVVMTVVPASTPMPPDVPRRMYVGSSAPAWLRGLVTWGGGGGEREGRAVCEEGAGAVVI